LTQAWTGGPEAGFLFLSWLHNRRIPLLYLTGALEYRGVGAPHVVVTCGVFELRLMPKNLKRYYGAGHLHFITFSCYRRLPLLGSAYSRNLFVHALEEIRERCRFLLVGYVVMPDHVHLLISESAKGTPSTMLKVLKQRVSHDLRKKWEHASAGQLPLPIAGGDSASLHFWQPRFHDFNVHSAKKRKEKLVYMHANPVKRGLVKSPAEWIWSSYSFYEKGEKGLISIDAVE
jgi:putative transposase